MPVNMALCLLGIVCVVVGTTVGVFLAEICFQIVLHLAYSILLKIDALEG